MEWSVRVWRPLAVAGVVLVASGYAVTTVVTASGGGLSGLESTARAQQQLTTTLQLVTASGQKASFSFRTARSYRVTCAKLSQTIRVLSARRRALRQAGVSPSSPRVVALGRRMARLTTRRAALRAEAKTLEQSASWYRQQAQNYADQAQNLSASLETHRGSSTPDAGEGSSGTPGVNADEPSGDQSSEAEASPDDAATAPTTAVAGNGNGNGANQSNAGGDNSTSQVDSGTGTGNGSNQPGGGTGPANAPNDSSIATINATFNADFTAVTYNADKDLSHYSYRLCDGTEEKVDMPDGSGLTLYTAAFPSQIVWVNFKAGSDLAGTTFETGVSCTQPDPEPDEPVVVPDPAVVESCPPGGEVRMYTDGRSGYNVIWESAGNRALWIWWEPYVTTQYCDLQWTYTIGHGFGDIALDDGTHVKWYTNPYYQNAIWYATVVRPDGTSYTTVDKSYPLSSVQGTNVGRSNMTGLTDAQLWEFSTKLRSCLGPLERPLVCASDESVMEQSAALVLPGDTWLSTQLFNVRIFTNTDVRRTLFLFAERAAEGCAGTAAQEALRTNAKLLDRSDITAGRTTRPVMLRKAEGEYRFCSYVTDGAASVPYSIDTGTMTFRKPRIELAYTDSAQFVLGSRATSYVSVSGFTEVDRRADVVLLPDDRACPPVPSDARSLTGSQSLGTGGLGADWRNSGIAAGTIRGYVTVSDSAVRGRARLCTYLAESQFIEADVIADAVLRKVQPVVQWSATFTPSSVSILPTTSVTVTTNRFVAVNAYARSGDAPCPATEDGMRSASGQWIGSRPFVASNLPQTMPLTLRASQWMFFGVGRICLYHSLMPELDQPGDIPWTTITVPAPTYSISVEASVGENRAITASVEYTSSFSTYLDMFVLRDMTTCPTTYWTAYQLAGGWSGYRWVTQTSTPSTVTLSYVAPSDGQYAVCVYNYNAMWMMATEPPRPGLDLVTVSSASPSTTDTTTSSA